MLPALVEAIRQGKAVPVIPVSADEEHRLPAAPRDDREAAPVPAAMGEVKVTVGERRTRRASPRPTRRFAAQVFKDAGPAPAGDLSYIRVYSGTLRAGGENLERVARVRREESASFFTWWARERHEVTELRAGRLSAPR